MSASIGLSAASEKSREFPAFSTGRGNAFCLRHVGDARHAGDGGYSPCLFGYVTMWVGASQSDAHQPIRTSVSETKEAVYRPMRGASWDEEQTTLWWNNTTKMYRKVSNIRHTLVGNKIVDHSDVVGAWPVGAAPTTSSFSTQHLASRDSAKTAARRYENLLSVGIWCVLY